MHDDSPFWLKAVIRPGAMVFAIMFTLESLARATMLTIVPLQALALLGNARDVSLLNTGVGIAGLVAGFFVPILIRRFRRRWVYSLGIAATAAGAGLIATATLPGQTAGMFAMAFGGAAANVTLNLYIMDYIRKQDFVRVEPLRLMLSAAAWAAGPFLGVWLNRHLGHGAGEMLSVSASALLLAYFWYLRIHDNPAVAAATRPPPDPIASIRRFIVQPRLRLGWFVSFGRSCWWSMFNVFGPLYMVTALGRADGETLGALMVSSANALLIFTPLVGRAARRTGIRPLIIAAFVGLGILSMATSLVFDRPILVAACLLSAAVGAVILDALGNIPFMRAVHPYERPQMTTVFRTYIDLSGLIPAGIFTLLLTQFDMRAVFIAAGLFALSVAWVARHLPKSM